MRLETVELDLPALAGAFGRRLRAAGVPVGAERASAFASALVLTKPVARRRLYWTARACFVTDPTQVRTFDRVFRDVFGASRFADDAPEVETAGSEEDGSDADDDLASEEKRAMARQSSHADVVEDVPVPVSASDEEVLGSKRFDSLSPAELVALRRLMAQLDIHTPERRTRRAVRDRRGDRVDLRRTLRGAHRTGGTPIRLARRRRRIVRRRLVLLCDISGSMEPYARAYLQFLTAAGPRAEAFVFATRLTRVTRALATRSPERALQRAAAAAPDWSSGTRIGDALRAFNDRHARRGMARGAIVVILSDGWERGDPALVGREMERLARLAHRIVWVNPRVSADGFVPRAGGMAAALPHVDALVSGHSLQALHEVIAAIAADHDGTPPELPDEEPEDDEPWGSATPVAGSSVAMPSGYGPKRGLTTPGWNG